VVIKTVTYFEIPASDVERLKKFYSDCFGWRFEKVNMPGFEYWQISTGPESRSVGGGMYKKMGPNDGPKNYVSVDNIDSAIEIFRKAGGSEIVGKQEVPGRAWYIGADPEGNSIGFWQQMKAARRTTGRRKSKR